MSQSVSTATIVGVSYIDLMDSNGKDTEPVDDAAAEVGLQTWGQMPRFDFLTDIFVGVIFYKRPTDAQVEEAMAKVKAALPRLTELLGPASSDVETWDGVSIS